MKLRIGEVITIDIIKLLEGIFGYSFSLYEVVMISVLFALRVTHPLLNIFGIDVLIIIFIIMTNRLILSMISRLILKNLKRGVDGK